MDASPFTKLGKYTLTDSATMNDILRNVLDKEPKHPFRKDDHKY